MKNAVMHFITANQISMETREKYEKVFLEMDVDKDGQLSREEISIGLQKMMEKEMVYMSQDDLENFMNLADSNSDGEISYQEFLSAVVAQEELTSDKQLK